MGRVFFILTTLSLMLALLTNRAPSAASALLNSAESGVSLMLTLLGTMTLWSGLMEVLLRTGDVAKLGLLNLPRQFTKCAPNAVHKVLRSVYSGGQKLIAPLRYG